MIDKIDRQNYRLGKAGLTFFSAVMPKWGLSEGEQAMILDLSKEELSQIKQSIATNEFIKFAPNMLQRLGLIFGISKDLNILYPPERIADYIKTKNSRFGGLSLIDKLLTGQIDDIREVRVYLKACCGSHFL